MTCAYCGERDATSSVLDEGRMFAACSECNPPGVPAVRGTEYRAQVHRSPLSRAEEERVRAIHAAEPSLSAQDLCERLGYGRRPARDRVYKRVHRIVTGAERRRA